MNNKRKVALKVTGLSKSFHLPTERANSLKQMIINRARGVKGYTRQEVLKDVSFTVNEGDFFGIVGRNGSGKSTLLKLISQIYEPEEGDIKVNGSLVPFIELGVGFNPELTGRENVYLNGALLGFSTDKIDEMYDEIVSFAELHDFMDQKLKNYSSGMQVRLAFSVAVRANSDILVLDEVLAVGDEAFQRKCNDYFEEVRKDGHKTVILVTHSMENVRRYCNKAILIREGVVVTDSSPEDVANEYSLENLVSQGHSDVIGEKQKTHIKDLAVSLLSSKRIDQADSIEFRVEYRVPDGISTYIAVTLLDVDRNIPLATSSSPIKNGANSSGVIATCIFSTLGVNDANIRVDISIRDKNKNILAYYPDGLSPVVMLRRTDYPDMRNKTTYSVLYDRGTWS